MDRSLPFSFLFSSLLLSRDKTLMGVIAASVHESANAAGAQATTVSTQMPRALAAAPTGASITEEMDGATPTTITRSAVSDDRGERHSL